MTASLHKLTCGAGYTYLTKSVAVGDGHRGATSLADYYSEKGETPGVWFGSGLAGLTPGASFEQVANQFSDPEKGQTSSFAVQGRLVDEAQMAALFGQLRHPDAEKIETVLKKLYGDERGTELAQSLIKLGRAPKITDLEPTSFDRAYHDACKTWREQNDSAEIPGSVRTEIRTQVGRETFRDEYGREPIDGELTHWIITNMRRKPQPVSGYDITFSPVKSVSVLWALADKPLTDRITGLHNIAVADTIRHLERHYLFTREGTNGVRQVETRGAITAMFVHRDSRNGDPDLHTHVAIANRVQTREGKWLAIDGREIYRWTVTLSEYYNNRLMSLLRDELGIKFVPVEKTPGLRPLWEIDGIPRELCDAFSSRRAQILARQRQLVSEFETKNGRVPSKIETKKLAQQATLETRPAKKEPRSFAEQRAAWRAQAEQLLGTSWYERGVQPALHTPQQPTTSAPLEASTVRKIIADVRETVTTERATWQSTHLTAETWRTLARHNVPLNQQENLVNWVVSEIKKSAVRLTPQPHFTAGLTRSDGTSVYSRADAELYTTRETLEAEKTILDAAGRTDGATLTPDHVATAIRTTSHNGVELNHGQRELVTNLATSGRRVQLAMAPAGTGKTTAMRVLAHAWTSAGGTVIGLSHQATAADQLREAMGEIAHCDTINSLTFRLDRQTSSSIDNNPLPQLPQWAQNVDSKTLIVIDEAGMASTHDLATLVTWAMTKGASIRLVGDDRQLAAIGAGGILRDIDTQYGSVHLSELMRFADRIEGQASLGLRRGEHEALAFYQDHQRVHPSAGVTIHDDVLDAWKTDTETGLKSLMLAGTRADTYTLNVGAQTWRIKTGHVDPTHSTRLANGSLVCNGDLITTRQNDRRIPISGTDHVKNRDRWQCLTVTRTGDLRVRHIGSNRIITLPAAYVSEHVELGYASTITGSQGITVDTTHTLIRGPESRNSLYVAATRGRHQNHLHVEIGDDADPHLDPFDDTQAQQTALETLEHILDNEGRQASATTTRQQAHDPFIRLAHNVDIYTDATTQACRQILGKHAIDEITHRADLISTSKLLTPLSEANAWDALHDTLIRFTVEGRHPIRALDDAINQRDLHSGTNNARDMAAVLYWRLTNTPTTNVTSWIPTPPHIADQKLRTPANTALVDELTALHRTIQSDIAQVRKTARSWTAETCPNWASPLLNTPLLEDCAVWRALTATPENQLAPLGDEPSRFNTVKHQAWKTLTDELIAYSEADTWTVPHHVKHDPMWPVIALRLKDLSRHYGPKVVNILVTRSSLTSLPAEQPAAALWYRCRTEFAHLTAAEHARIQPEWAQLLLVDVPETFRDAIVTAPQWIDVVDQINATPASQRDETIQAAISLVAPSHDSAEDWLADFHARYRDLTAIPATDETPDFTDTMPEPNVPEDNLPWTPVINEHGEPLSSTSVPRILELNKQAADWFTQHYRGGPRTYMRSRFGTDLADDPRFRIGYAPSGWDTLTTHLISSGATADELVDAGLAKYTRNGHLIDVFRDRLMIAYTDHDAVLGFCGRAAPGSTAPKYLNTKTTPAFTKGNYLYGADLLTPTTTPVVVEGPMDAIAITLAGHNSIGLAPGGTALTQAQIAKIHPNLEADPFMILATDADEAGQKAAEKSFKMLIHAGADPHSLLLTGKDPADMWQNAPNDLATQLDAAKTLLPSTAVNLVLANRRQRQTKLVDPRDPTQLSEADKYAISRYAQNMIALIPDPTTRDQAINDVMQELGENYEPDEAWKTQNLPSLRRMVELQVAVNQPIIRQTTPAAPVTIPDSAPSRNETPTLNEPAPHDNGIDL